MSAYLLYSGLTFLAALVLTPAAIWLSLRLGAIDVPSPRRIHSVPTGRLGGAAIFAAAVIGIIVVPIDASLKVLLIASGSFIFLIGLVDDLRNLPPKVKLIAQTIVALLLVAGGVTIGGAVSNPFGAAIVFPAHGLFSLIPALLTVIWVILLINTVNVLDGIDGVAAGVVAIAAITIFGLSLKLGQAEGALLALVLAGVALGFLPWNFSPAKIFMGDSGSMFLGFMLAVVSMISGAKIATAVLVLGLPILDLLWAVWRRHRKGVSIFSPDTEHLHQRLLGTGLDARVVALIFYGFSGFFGIIALMGQTRTKLIAMAALIVIMGLLILYTVRRARAKKSPKIDIPPRE